MASLALKGNLAVNLCKDRVILADADIVPRMEMRAALAHDDAACRHMRACLLLHAKALRVAVTSVARRADALFMCKKLQIKREQIVHPFTS